MRSATVPVVALLVLAPAAVWAEGDPGVAKDIPLGPLRADLGAELRLRYEHNNQKSLRGYEPGTQDGFLLERVLLNGALRWGKDARLVMQLRDARAFGSDLGDGDFTKSNPIHDPLDVRQAYAEWLHIGGTPLGARVGRQSISYGDQRLFSPGQWGNTGRWAWDAAMMKVDTPWYDVDMWVGRPIENRPDRSPNRAAEGPTALVGHAKLEGLPLRLDLFHAVRYDGSGTTKGETGVGNTRRHSTGVQAEGTAWEWFGWGGTVVVQRGVHGRDAVRAYGVNAKASARLAETWEPRLTAQVTWGSGDEDPDDGVAGTFDGVFGGADMAFYGYLNIFYWPNLRDHEVTFDLAPHSKLSLQASYHYMMLSDPGDAWYSTSSKAVRQDPSGASGSELGHELDARAIWQAWAGAELLVAGGVFLPGAFVRATGESPRASWMTVQVAQTF